MRGWENWPLFSRVQKYPKVHRFSPVFCLLHFMYTLVHYSKSATDNNLASRVPAFQDVLALQKVLKGATLGHPHSAQTFGSSCMHMRFACRVHVFCTLTASDVYMDKDKHSASSISLDQIDYLHCAMWILWRDHPLQLSNRIVITMGNTFAHSSG